MRTDNYTDCKPDGIPYRKPDEYGTVPSSFEWHECGEGVYLRQRVQWTDLYIHVLAVFFRAVQASGMPTA